MIKRDAMNEEGVKNKIIVPFFHEMGFNTSEIEYETSFTLKLGRHTIPINGERDRASGRLDILFKKNGENLFIVETKPLDHVLSEQDKHQAISYARLLEKMAPFAIVTNGICTKIYDALTGEDLSNKRITDSAYVKNGYILSLDSELKYRALKSFIGLNFDNLRIFCKKQLELNMKNLRADKDNLERKFVQEVFLRRKGIKEAFDLFLSSRDKIFLIVGESGFGKSNAICDLTLEYSNANPTLFFNGASILTGITEEIANELNWEFEGEREGISIIKRIIDLLSQHNRELIIFIDAIDEAPQRDFVLHLDNFIKHLPDEGIKLCFTCKDSSLHRFLSISGNPSFISSCLYSSDKKKDPRSFKIGPFADDELDVAIRRYREFYCLPEIQGYARDLCKNPLMLRVLSETYRGQRYIPQEIVPTAVVRSFLEKKLEKSENREEDLNFLSLFGRTLFDNNTESLYEDEIAGTLSVSEYLVSFSLLRRTQDYLGRYKVGFQYDYIRDFVICFYSLKMDKLGDEQITDLVSQKIQEELPNNVFRYFEKTAEQGKKRILREAFSRYNRMRATQFINEYQRILDTEFTIIKNRFYPYTTGDIGLLVFYHLDPYFRPQYGFRRIKENEEKVVWLEKENWFNGTSEDLMKITAEYGVGMIFSSFPDFTNIAPTEYARKGILEQLKNLIEKRLLDESENIVLSIEYILDKLREYNNTFGLPKFDENFWSKVFPISLEELAEKVGRYVESLQMQLERFDLSATPADLLELQWRIDIVKKVQKTIEKTLLPFPSNCKIPRLGAWLCEKYTETELINYLTTFFSLLYQELRTIVARNLPSLKDSMHTYTLLPPRIIGEIEKEDDHFKGLTYCVIPGRENVTIELTIKGKESIFDPVSFTVQTSSGKVKIDRYSSIVIWDFFMSDSRRDNIIQRHVYELIYDDLKEIFHW